MSSEQWARRWCTWRQSKLISIRNSEGALQSKIFCMHAQRRLPISMRMHFPCRPLDRKVAWRTRKKRSCEWVTWDLYEHRAKLIACVAVSKGLSTTQPRIRWTTTCMHADAGDLMRPSRAFPWAAIRIFHGFSFNFSLVLFISFVVLASLFACSLCVF